MIKIFVFRQSRYPANTKNLKDRVRKILDERGITEVEVGVALVGERKMRELAQRYLGESKDSPLHEVLSFSASQMGKMLKDDTGTLGDIVLCYPEARRIAMKKNKMVDDVLGELAEHGLLHLLGVHH